MRYESSRGHKIDGTKQTKPGSYPEKKNRESRQKKTRRKVAINRHRRQGGTQKRHKRKMNKQEPGSIPGEGAMFRTPCATFSLRLGRSVEA